MFAELVEQWFSVLTFLSDKYRALAAEFISVLIFGLVIYLTAKIVKWVGHLFFGSKFMDRRFPRLMQALKHARFHTTHQIGHAETRKGRRQCQNFVERAAHRPHIGSRIIGHALHHFRRDIERRSDSRLGHVLSELQHT